MERGDGKGDWGAAEASGPDANIEQKSHLNLAYVSQGAQNKIAPLGEHSPGRIDDDEISLFADFQRSVCVRSSQGIGCVDGGSGQGFRHGQSHVHAGQVHDHRLRQARTAVEERNKMVAAT